MRAIRQYSIPASIYCTFLFNFLKLPLYLFRGTLTNLQKQQLIYFLLESETESFFFLHIVSRTPGVARRV